jgi:type I restriction enzyme S subunit
VSELPRGWAYGCLADLGAWCGGGTPSKSRSEFWTNGSIPWVSPKDMKVNLIADAEDHITQTAVAGSATNVVSAGSVLIVVRSGILRRTFPVAVTASSVALNQDLKALRPAEGIDPRYVAWFLRGNEQAILHECAKDGTTVDSLDFPALLRRVMPVAPSAEQVRVVAAIEEQFSRLSAGVAMLDRAQQNLRRMRTAVLQMAVTGRLVLQDPGEGSGADLLATIKLTGRRASRRGEDLTTLLPPLPLSWSTAPWSTIAYSQNGRAFPSGDYSTVGTRLLRPGNLYASGEVGWTTANTRHLPERYASEFPEYLVGPNEIIMNLTAQSLKDEFLGRACMTGPQEEPVLLNQRLARLTPIGVNPRFIFYVLKSPLFRRFVDQLNTGSLIQHMFTSQLDQFVVPIPPRGEQDRIVRRIEEILVFFDHLEEAIRKIGKRAPALRSAILDAAFTGRLVPQDPSDEPASELLELIAVKRASSNGKKSVRTPRPRRVRQKVTL